jgi:hypothetical protein
MSKGLVLEQFIHLLRLCFVFLLFVINIKYITCFRLIGNLQVYNSLRISVRITSAAAGSLLGLPCAAVQMFHIYGFG